MLDKYLKRITWISIIFLSLYFLYLVITPINLHTADLGRHLKNGELFFTQGLIPKTNLYSYSYPDFPFVDHHWGTGVIFYAVYQIAGFAGLSLFFGLFSLVTFLLFFDLAYRNTNIFITLPITLLALPLAASRTEIRPELFSYLFIALFLWLLYTFNQSKLNQKWLYAIPFLELLWVNIHIYFPFGLLLLAIFGAEKLIQYLLDRSKQNLNQLKTLIIIGLISGGVTLINPNGLTGVLYPLHIFDNYGYKVLENQSVAELDRLISYPPTPFFKSLFVMLSLSWIVSFLSFKPKKWLSSGSISLLTISVIFSLMSLNAVRNFSLFALFCIPIISINLKNLTFSKLKIDQSSANFFYPMLLVGILLFTLFVSSDFWVNRGFSTLGTYPQADSAVKFFQQNNLKGPIFNNYDNGGLLTWYLYPQEKVFVDNRPEAYPSDFFQKTYIPLQQDDQIWKEQSQKYNFNVIFFYRHDLTNWGQKFLVTRIKDPEWAPVYVDNFEIIFLKINEENAALIKKYRLPDEMFHVRSN